MRKIIYDVAASLDGYICDLNGDPTALPQTGGLVDYYRQRLASYETVIMGRKTYEYGYAFGIQPGQRGYAHMDHHIFSKSIVLPQDRDVAVIRDNWEEAVRALKQKDGGDIYLCGGGEFAGFLAERNLIDILRIKQAPLVYGSGMPLFGGFSGQSRFRLVSAKYFDAPAPLLEYELSEN
jgi:dihydrofolate reductase